MQQHLEDEARADVGEKQQGGAGVEPARRHRAAPAESPAAGEKAGENDPAEDREQRLVIPTPRIREPGAEDDRRRKRDKAGADETKRQTLEAKDRQSIGPRSGSERGATHLPLGAAEQQRMKNGDAEKAVRSDAEEPVQRRPHGRRECMDLA